MKIWHQSIVDMGRATAYDEVLKELAQRSVSPGVTVQINGIRQGSYAGHSPARASRYAFSHHLIEAQVVENAVRAERLGFDAVAICTLQDPGLELARTMVNIPVVGYGESAMHIACTLGQRFGIVAFNEPLFPLFEAQIDKRMLRGRAVPTTSIQTDYSELLNGFAHPKKILEAFVRAARSAIGAGADVIIPGQALLGAVLAHNDIRDVDGAAVIDPILVTLKMAEMMVSLSSGFGLKRSNMGFFGSRPPADLIQSLKMSINTEE